MTARERILAIRLLEKQERNPEYAKQIGIQVTVSVYNNLEHHTGGVAYVR